MITPILTYPNSGTDTEEQFKANVESYVPALKTSGDEITQLDTTIENMKDQAEAYKEYIVDGDVLVDDSLPPSLDMLYSSSKIATMKNGEVPTKAVQYFNMSDERVNTSSFISLIPKPNMCINLIAAPTNLSVDMSVEVRDKSGNRLKYRSTTTSPVFISIPMGDLAGTPVDIFISGTADTSLECIYWVGIAPDFAETITPPA